MTVALIVTTGGRQVGKVIVEKDAFLIGRSKRCDLVLDDKNVSREHAVLVAKAGRYTILDRGSRNSTLLNGVQLTAQALLKEGDQIRIGPYELRFLENAPPLAEGEQDLSKTRFGPPGSPSGQDKQTIRKTRHAGDELVYKLTATEGPLKGNFWDNWDGDLTFGRGPNNKVILQDAVVSIAHARIKQEDGLLYLEDLDSSNGTFLQGVRVRSARLKNNQQIRIGTSCFIFDLVDPAKKRSVRTIIAISLVFLAVLGTVVLLMKPDDRATPLIEQGLQFGKNGDFERAKALFEDALTIRPGDPAAEKYLQDANSCIERDKILQTAKSAADNEQFDEALNICSKLLIKYPGYNKARELESIIGKVRDAQMALDAKNWADAAKLLAKAAESYPDSAILARRLAFARAELAAQDNLEKAKNFLAQSRHENAVELLMAIPASSAYSQEAKELLQNMESSDLLAAAVREAQAAYALGNISDARASIAKGLKLSPDNSELLELDKHIGEVDRLWEELNAGKQGLVNSSNVTSISRALDACKRLAMLEPDAQNFYRQQADQLKLQLGLALGAIEKAAIAKANAFEREGNKREAYRCYAQAASVNPGSQTIRRAMDVISTEISDECQKIFREGLVYEETGQPDLAIAAYERVQRIAIDGDRYSERATEKLRQLKK